MADNTPNSTDITLRSTPLKGSSSGLLTPPVTPVKIPHFTKGEPSYSSASPISPTIHIHAATPWYSSPAFVAVAFGCMGLCAFGIHHFSPIIASTAGALTNIGHVVGSLGNLGNAVGDSIQQTNRIAGGLAGGFGDIWCATIGGAVCEKAAVPIKASEEVVYTVGSNSLLQGTKLTSVMTELGTHPLNSSTPRELDFIGAALSSLPLLEQFADAWMSELSIAGKHYQKVLETREEAYAGMHTVLRGLVDQYMVTSRVSRLSPFFLDFSRNEALVSELTDMALYTYENHGTAIRTLSEVQVSASGMCDAGEDVLRRVRSTLMALERTKAHSLASRKCRWMGLCHEELHEVEWTVKMLNAIVPMLDQRIADAVKLRSLSAQSIRELNVFVKAFNVTAGISDDDETGKMKFGRRVKPQLTIQRLDPGLTELALQMRELPLKVTEHQ